MIRLTRLNGTAFWLNAEHIMTLEGTPDTVITLTNGEKWVVQESPDAVADAVIAYRRQAYVLPTPS